MLSRTNVLTAAALASAAVAWATPQTSPGVVITDVDLACGSVASADDVVAFTVGEAGQGVDLNGDGDMTDAVVHLHRPSTGVTTNLGLAGSVSAVVDGRVLIRVSELTQAATDLNGDGDIFDSVLHVHDAFAATTTNLGLAPLLTTLQPDFTAFTVRESDNGGVDLNGDGDSFDSVLHVHDFASATTTNQGLALSGWASDERGVAFGVSEGSQGAGDLNNDGDAFDVVLHLYDAAAKTSTNALVAVGPFQIEVHGGGVATSFAEEFSQGGDLNGDGDSNDQVLQLHQLAGATTLNLGAAATDVAGSPRLVAYLVNEVADGSVDLNGDGDVFDSIVHVRDLATGITTNLGLAGAFFPDLLASGGRVLFGVPEADQGAADLNGDGDPGDTVVFTYDVVKQTSSNVGLALSEFLLDGNLAVIAVAEFQQGSDLNGDGDSADVITHVHDLATGSTVNTQVSGQNPRIDGSLISWRLDESGGDLNGDGDTDDDVLHAWDARLGVLVNTGLATFAQGWSGWSSQLAVLVPEAGQGDVDQNGDGDTSDSVVHVASLPVLAGLRADVDFLDLSAGGTQPFELDAGPALAGDLHWVLGSASGSVPGTTVDGLLVALNPDAYTGLLLLDSGAAPFTGFLGTLDGLGRATASIDLPPATDPTLAGQAFHHAWVAFDLTIFPVGSFSSNAVRLELIP